jgi:hypothetical protein
MSWREAFSVHFGPGTLAGITLGRWLRVLRENHFSVDLPYWGRAATVTLGAIPNTVLSWWENLRYGRKIRETPIAPPLFVLGIWRSGTTHLHNLLSKDDRFACPTFYQTVYPHTFLTTEKINARLVGWFLPEKRPQDNMRLSVQGPQEDEWALCSLTGRTFLMSLFFPRRADQYDRYLTLRHVPEKERAEWLCNFKWFLRKLSLRYGRPLVLKSPGHTCRIRLLLELFPGAKFVHIHRNPYAVFQSSRRTVLKVSTWSALQRPDHSDLDDRTMRQYKEAYDAYFEERGLIPKGHFHEIGFEEVEADPLGQLRGVYEALALPDFGHVEPAVERYLRCIAGYEKNTFPELPADLQVRIAREWRRSFDEWGYPT